MTPVIANAVGTEPHNAARPNTAGLARTLYKELRASGCDPEQVLAVCTQMLDEVTRDLKGATGNSEASAA